jgi:hypothetical protein
MAECIDQGFAADPINVIADGRLQGQSRAFHDDAKPDSPLEVELLRNSGE